MKYTKGPWHVIETNNMRDKKQKAYLLANPTPHIHGYIDGAMSDADLRLIVAAPEMLEAIEYILKEVTNLSGTGENDGHIGWRHINKLRDAISKAKGE